MKTQFIIRVLVLFVFTWGIYGCDKNTKQDKPIKNKNTIIRPAFSNADSLYEFVKKQVDFGPRVPNTKAHVNCGDYLVNSLKIYGLEVYEQTFIATAYNGDQLNSRNIIGSINPKAQKRIMIAAHWDTRPYADQDSTKKNIPIAGANDGGSGVAVLLELARVITSDTSVNRLKVGVDLVFFDSEDYGAPKGYVFSDPQEEQKMHYCLGSQYWAENRHKENYRAYYGVLLDMVGCANATFYKEGYSMEFAPAIVEKVWKMAKYAGAERYFVAKKSGGAITDDHVPVNEKTGIPMIDIIDHDDSNGDYFMKHWHKHTDNLQHIDKKTLEGVTNTLLYTLYNEK